MDLCYNPFMGKNKEIRTNAMRILERLKIPYTAVSADIGDFESGIKAADKEGLPYEETFKTLVARGHSGDYCVLVIPIAREVDLKKAARAAEEKSLSLIAVKDLTPLTGYVRGGCSPIGMKKAFKTYLGNEAEALPKIYISGGQIGLSLQIAPEDLKKACGAVYADLTTL